MKDMDVCVGCDFVGLCMGSLIMFFVCFSEFDLLVN